MTSVGETLRAERLKRNLALDQISRELKISSRFLAAIETGEFNKLPGGVFTRSFVRQYARLLGLDEEELAGQVQRVLEPPPEAPQLSKAKAIESGFHVPKMEEWESVGENRFRWSGSLSAAAIFVVALLICSGVYTWMQRPHTADTVTTKAAPPTVSPPVSPTAAPPAPISAPPPPSSAVPETAAAGPNKIQPAQPKPEPVAAAPASPPPQPSSPITQPAQSDRTAPVHVEVTADEAVWILVRVDGKYSFSGTLEANQTRSVEAAGTVILRLGNAGSVNITLNGKPIGPVGPKGQARTVQFTSGGFQIVPAKPPAALDPL